MTLIADPRPDDGAVCAPIAHDRVSVDNAEDLARSFKALADPTRVRIVSIVAASDGQKACVCDLTDPIGLSQSTVSHHLKILMDAGFLTRSKSGTWAYYTLVPGALDRLSQVLVAT